MVHLIIENNICSIPLYSTNIKIEFHIAWNLPPPSHYKLNVDGSQNTTTRCITCGVLIWYTFDNFIKGFWCNIGTSTVIFVALWGLFLDHKLTRDQGAVYLLLEYDSQVSIQIVQCTWSGWNVSLKHIYSCVDFLANFDHYGSFS